MKLPEFWKTGALLLVLAGLGSYIWFVERKQQPKPEGEREKVTVLAVDKAKAKEISLAVASGEAIRLVKEGSAWKVTAPFAAPADTSAVESDAHGLEKLEADEVVVGAGREPARVRPRQAEPARSTAGASEGAPGARSPSSSARSPRTRSSVYARAAGSPKVYLWSRPGSRAASTRSPSTCATGTSSHVSATTSGRLEVTRAQRELRPRARTDARRSRACHEAARHQRRPLVRGRPPRHRSRTCG